MPETRGKDPVTKAVTVRSSRTGALRGPFLSRMPRNGSVDAGLTWVTKPRSQPNEIEVHGVVHDLVAGVGVAVGGRVERHGYVGCRRGA